MTIVVGHLYPDYLNIYADRGNIAVLARRAAWRGHELEVRAIGLGDPIEPGACALYYIGGGQDREQALVAADLAAKGEALAAEVERGAALLAVCGGYQLLGRGYRDVQGRWLAGAGLFPLETRRRRAAHDRRRPARVRARAGRAPRTVAGFENHAGRTLLDPGAVPLGRVLAGFGNDGESGFEGCRVGRALGTYLHGPLLPRNPWLADWLLGQALGGVALEPLPDELEAEAHDVSAARARARGGRARAPRARRGTPRGRRGASAGGTAGSAGASRRRPAPRA